MRPHYGAPAVAVVQEVGVVWVDDRDSRVRVLSTIAEMLRGLLRLRLGSSLILLPSPSHLPDEAVLLSHVDLSLGSQEARATSRSVSASPIYVEYSRMSMRR